MIAFPHAKINIGLRVVARRDDGFHDIESIFYPIGWCDVLECVESGGGKGRIAFTQTGIPLGGDPGDNLCVRAYRLLSGRYSLPSVCVHLHKLIPPGSGLGGGSSDAMHMLAMLNRMFGLGMDTAALRGAGLELGSDVPFFALSAPAAAAGRGERLEPVDAGLDGRFLAVVFPDIGISTAEAYGLVEVKKPVTALAALVKQPAETWKGSVENAFERVVFPMHAKLAEIREQMYAAGAVFASLSGSGSAIYGIFDFLPDTEKLFPNFLVYTSRLPSVSRLRCLYGGQDCILPT